MLKRVADTYDFLGVPDTERERARPLVEAAAALADGMTALQDYHALAAVALRFKPRSIFEIGTYRGVTSNFFLDLLPESSVVSIAYVAPRLRIFGKGYNNEHASKEDIGGAVTRENRGRFTQLYGDSHELDTDEMTRRFGAFDLVFIDGDHSRAGVRQDTVLADAILSPNGTICWHDANPKDKYLPVREFLEQELERLAIATQDDYVGGVACWNRALST